MYRGAQRYAAAGPRRIEGLTRDEACLRYRRKVLVIARRIYERLSPEASVQLDDLVSCGAIGLLEAYDRFDVGRDVQFSTFAEYRIRGAMYDALRTHDTFTRRRRQLAKQVDHAQQTMRHELGREPEHAEVAERLELTLEQYHAALERVSPISHVSLDAPDPDAEDDRPLLDRLVTGNRDDPDHQLRVRQIRTLLAEAIEQLPDKQRECVIMYYGKGMSLAEIGEVYGVTVSRISQILSQARGRLRKKLLPKVDPSDAMMELNP